MQVVKIISALVVLSALLCCGRTEPGAYENIGGDESIAKTIASSSAAVENTKDTSRKFIRTADLKFKVKNVVASTYDIEDITNRQGGFVTFTNLSGNIENVVKTKISADSLLETTHYTVVNTITLRVPNIKLDTTLKEISRNIDFLDYRVIKAEDVALQILTNNLAQKRNQTSEKRLESSIDNKGKKLIETTTAEELLYSKQTKSDELKVSNLSIADQINFSTVNIHIYQSQSIKREVIADENNIKEYEAGFGTKVLESLKEGCSILEAIFVSLVKLWGIILLAVLGYFLYRRVNNKLKK